MAEFQNGLCGCTNNCGLCLMTYFCHCYTAGKGAESVGKSCCIYGCLSMTPLIICSNVIVRGAIREKYGIGGSLLGDVFAHWCCTLCAMVQEGQEVIAKNDMPPGAICMSRE